MAHSNRKKLREARGGLTRNQLRKQKNQQNSGGQSNRLQETIRWIESNEEKRRQKPTAASTPVKAIIYSKHKRVIIRRKGALNRLEIQLGKGMKPGKRPVRGIDITLDDKDITRIKTEIKTLKARI